MNKTEIFLSRDIGEFVPDNRWVATLSNSEVIYEDQHPAYPAHQVAWKRLADYVEQNSLSIVDLKAQVAGCNVNLPINQEGYVQYKKFSSTGAISNLSLCIGFVQGEKAKIFLIGANKSSRSIIINDPGEPKTIYRLDRR